MYELVTLGKSGQFELDEKSGIRMKSRLLGSQLFSLFKVSGTVLQSKYDLRGDTIYYEITSYRESDLLKTEYEKNQQLKVESFSLLSVQRAELKRVKKQ